MDGKKIVIRADAGLQIGTGHIMRCLTLADALRARGAAVIFLTREHEGHIVPAIISKGYRAVTLAGNTGRPYGSHSASPRHAEWLEADWRDDAATTRKLLEEVGASWLIVDHYALDRSWEEAALPDVTRLMVIDDLADRAHSAELLLDQNAGRNESDYDSYLPADCIRLIGPKYALLRPEFYELRSEAMARRLELDRPRSLLITLGGIDKDNATSSVLDALASSPSAKRLKVTVILGDSAPWLDYVRKKASHMPMQTELLINVSNMAEHMLFADVCIGAAGSTAWERCALGLPTLQVVLAENQAAAAAYLSEQGVVTALPNPTAPGFADALSLGLDHLSDPETYREMARNAASVTDGIAVDRIAQRLLEATNG